MLIGVLSDLKCLNDEKSVVVFGQIGLSQSHTVEGLVVFQYFGFILQGEVVVDWYKIYSFCDDDGLTLMSWRQTFYLVLCVFLFLSTALS